MRYRIVALMLLFVLPVMYPFAAPVPERPYAILDIGPPPKEKKAEEHCKEQIGHLMNPRYFLFKTWCDPEVKKLRVHKAVSESVKGKEIYPWLAKNLRITEEKEKGKRRLRLTFQAGTKAEQVVILNTLLRIYMQLTVTEPARNYEKFIRDNEETAPKVAKLIKEEKDDKLRVQYQRQRDASLTRDKEFRVKIARLKQVTVIKWAK